jgi:Rhodococcus equi virulence-associated protein
MSSSVESIDRATIAEDFRGQFADTLPAEVIDSAAAHLESAPQAATASYPAKGSIASMIVWMRCECRVDGGKQFTGDSWGISFPGGGALFGDVYTDDLNALYANTRSFALAATPVYTSFVFFDDNHSPLGSFQAGSVSTVSGTGGGKGGWS